MTIILGIQEISHIVPKFKCFILCISSGLVWTSGGSCPTLHPKVRAKHTGRNTLHSADWFLESLVLHMGSTCEIKSGVVEMMPFTR